VELSKNSSERESLNGSKVQIKGTTPQVSEEDQGRSFGQHGLARSPCRIMVALPRRLGNLKEEAERALIKGESRN
jgi:hypothetical protein